MKTGFLVVVSALSALTLTGCTTVSESDYRTVRSAIADSPSLKREIIANCIADRRNESLNEQKTNAAFMNVSVANYPSAFCNRMFKALASGRITYQDVKNLDSSSADQSKIIRILQGK